MNVQDVRVAIENRLLNGITTVPVVLPNQDFDPQSPGGSFPAGGPWVELERISVIAGRQLASGLPVALRERRWAGYVRICTPSGVGSGAGSALASSVEALFRGVTLGSPEEAWFEEPTTTFLGNGPARGGAYSQEQVRIPMVQLVRM